MPLKRQTTTFWQPTFVQNYCTKERIFLLARREKNCFFTQTTTNHSSKNCCLLHSVKSSIMIHKARTFIQSLCAYPLGPQLVVSGLKTQETLFRKCYYLSCETSYSVQLPMSFAVSANMTTNIKLPNALKNRNFPANLKATRITYAQHMKL